MALGQKFTLLSEKVCAIQEHFLCSFGSHLSVHGRWAVSSDSESPLKEWEKASQQVSGPPQSCLLALSVPTTAKREGGAVEKASVSATPSPKPRNAWSKLGIASMTLLLTPPLTLITVDPWSNTFFSCELNMATYWLRCCQNEICITKTLWARRLIIFVQPFFLNQSLTNYKSTWSLIWEIIFSYYLKWSANFAGLVNVLIAILNSTLSLRNGIILKSFENTTKHCLMVRLTFTESTRFLMNKSIALYLIWLSQNNIRLNWQYNGGFARTTLEGFLFFLLPPLSLCFKIRLWLGFCIIFSLSPDSRSWARTGQTPAIKE